MLENNHPKIRNFPKDVLSQSPKTNLWICLKNQSINSSKNRESY